MKIKCDFCGSIIDESLKNCPNCGAVLSGANRTSSEQPKTIEELKAWYVAHHLPPEHITRFFIGKNITEPKAFGIYKDVNGDCVVYKNKSTGERAIRYQGADEAYAVNELYQRLKAEIVDQKSRTQGNAPRTSQRTRSQYPTAQPKKKKKGCFIAIILFVLLSMLVAIFDKSAPSGYYRYQGKEYYHYGSSWYYYDDKTDDWYESESMSDEINKDNANDYRYDNHVGKDFKSSSWYDSGSHSNDYDWDDDDDWDSGSDSWDSGSTDWDSDW